jgi:hypothetical protein
MRGQLKFLAETSAPPYFAPSVGGSDAQSTLVGDFEMCDVEILDARALDEDFSLDTHGFELRTVSEVGDLYDPEVVSSKHEPQCRELVTAVTGASRVDIFDHTWRSDAADTRGQHGSREPSSFVHNDYTPWSAPKRVVDILGDEGERLTGDDFAIVNVWRPITTVYSSPVALCDARSVAADSLVPAERRGKGRVGEVYVVHYDSQQRWVYFPELAPGEVLLIKTFDSRDDGRARWCVHTAVEEAGESEKPPRESIETRLFAFL